MVLLKQWVHIIRMSDKINIIQINMNNRREVSEQVRDFCRANQVDIALLQEPPVAEDGCTVYDLNFGGVRTVMMASKDGRTPGAAILILNTELRVITPEYQNLNMVMIVSIFFKYSLPTINFVEMISKVSDKERVIIGADTNAHSILWHCPNNNNRGVLLNDLIKALPHKAVQNG